MNKVFQSFDELLDFDFSELEHRSNYLNLIPSDGILPKINEEFHPTKWQVRSHPKELEPQIVFEITPKWLIVTFHGLNNTVQNAFKLRFKSFENDAKSIIKKIFEP